MTDFFFDYELPHRLVAQHPVERRDQSRLMVLHRATHELEHRHFHELPSLLNAGDRVVLNETKVIPARLIGTRCKTGGQWEGLFVAQHADGTWELRCKTRGYPDLGERFAAKPNPSNIPVLELELLERTAERHWLMKPHAHGTLEELLAQYGKIPLPPYIRGGTALPEDTARYQTVFARQAGSVAAPTAGLHFTPELLAALQQQGITDSRVTLHVGLGTFASVTTENPLEHAIHAEWAEVPLCTVEAIRTTQAQGGRIVAVGTTATRALESAARQTEPGLHEYRGPTSLYIHPPFEWRVVQGLITNFHMPRTTLLLLVSALAGGDFLRQAYEEAIRHEYRFYTYGDAMLIL